jgi:transcriptional regulator GlxA family with amidase domain
MGALRSRARMNAATISSLNGATSRNGSDVSSAMGADSNGASLTRSKSVTPIREERLQKILEMIESGKPCTIDALAEQFNLSHSRLQHLFKQQTGMSLGHLLTQQRLYRAAHLLTHSNKRIKEIAHAVGYEHASSFIRAFERHFAKAPRLFRQTQNGKSG